MKTKQELQYMSINIDIMRLHIAPNRIISDIQKEFNQAFPFLKLEFFNNKTFARSDFSANKIFPSHRKIGECQLAITDGVIEISGEMKVKELEKMFTDEFSLAVQVFRKSGNLWLETTMTDNWTLYQQNNHGKELSTERTIAEEAGDYDLNRDPD